jgi:hypothetical protein
MIWGPFVLALGLGLIVSAGLYFAYMWPHVEPVDADAPDAPAPPAATASPPAQATQTPPPAVETAVAPTEPPADP